MPDGLTLTEEQVAEIEAGLNTPVRREDAIVAKAERRKGAGLGPDDEAKLRGVLRLLRGSDPAVLDALRDRLEGADEGANDRDATAKCRKCGTAVKADSKFCHKCGGRVGKADDEPGTDGPTPGASRCGKCGRKVTMAEAYCTRCGAAQTGSGNDFREKFRKAANRPRALAERAKRFDEETSRTWRWRSASCRCTSPTATRRSKLPVRTWAWMRSRARRRKCSTPPKTSMRTTSRN